MSRYAVFGCALVVAAGVGSASAGPILMPAGSTVWMKFESNQAPDADADDAAGSNQPGIAPPNGIPLTTVTESGISTSGYAEVLPDRIRTYTVGFSQFMHSSFQDTYTVGGSAAGPFEITVQFRATGIMRPFEVNGFHQLLAGNVQVRIGTFNPDPTLVNESFRVTPFSSATEATSGVHSLFAPGSVPVDITASYTKTGVNVGDVFDIAYQLRSAASRGEIDLRNTGTIAFVLPQGVTLTSSLAQSIPEPGPLFAPALAAAAALTRRTRRRLLPRWPARFPR